MGTYALGGNARRHLLRHPSLSVLERHDEEPAHVPPHPRTARRCRRLRRRCSARRRRATPKCTTPARCGPTMLWDCYVGLLRDTANYTFDTAGKQMRDYLVASLKLTPTAPTFVEARDAWLLAAARQHGHAERLHDLRARRSRAAASAPAPSPPTRTSTDEQRRHREHRRPAPTWRSSASRVDDDGASCDDDHVLDNGETGTVTREGQEQRRHPAHGRHGHGQLDRRRTSASPTARRSRCRRRRSATTGVVTVNIALTGVTGALELRSRDR